MLDQAALEQCALGPLWVRAAGEACPTCVPAAWMTPARRWPRRQMAACASAASPARVGSARVMVTCSPFAQEHSRFVKSPHACSKTRGGHKQPMQ